MLVHTQLAAAVVGSSRTTKARSTPGSAKPMLQDLEARKPLEYEAFNGIVIKLLRQAGQTAPVNQTFYALLQHLDRKSREEAAP